MDHDKTTQHHTKQDGLPDEKLKAIIPTIVHSLFIQKGRMETNLSSPQSQNIPRC